MSQDTEMQSGVFRTPRIPFHLPCVILATAGFLVVYLANHLLGWMWDRANPVGQFLSILTVAVGQIPFVGQGFQTAMGGIWGLPAAQLSWWQAVLTGILFFGIWSVFSAAVMRSAALRLTRDEPFSIREALRFGARSVRDFLFAPLLVAGFALLFVALNALAGAVMSVWFVGSSLLAIVLFPLSLIAALFIILSLLGGIFGLPLIWAGISVERNGAMEGVSRAFSYIFARPFQFFFGYLLLLLLMGAVMLVGHFFEETTKTTIKLGVWRQSFDDSIRKEPAQVRDLVRDYEDSAAVKRGREGIANLANVKDAHWSDKLGFVWMWALLNAFLLGFRGYALYIFLGGTVSLYLQLRQEVDQTDPEEISLEEEETSAGGPAEPRWVGTPPQPPSPPPPGAGAPPAS